MDFYKVKELAEMLGISEATIRKLLHKGDIPFYKVGGVTLIDKGDFADYLKRIRREQRAK